MGGIHNYITPILTEAGPSVTRELRGVSLRNSRFAGRCLPSSVLPSNVIVNTNLMYTYYWF
jgi:hypothetical protein